MKKLLLTLIFVSPFVAKSQVAVSTSQYTASELINSVLLNNAFIPATNITSVTGTNFNSVNGLGYFQKNDSDFQFANGIILSSGDAVNANGPAIDPILSSGSDEWPGDSDMDAITTASGSLLLSKNATVLEFNFIALQDQLSLDYIFASNEYGPNQCDFNGDETLFLLKDITTGSSFINIAVIPNTTSPVSVKNIKDSNYNSSCPSVNPEYFGYYTPNFSTTAPISLRGATIPVRAETPVIPGHMYHLKLILADQYDSLYDSAIFIEAGSFKCGNLNAAEMTVKSSLGTILCDGFTTELSVPYNDLFAYEWSYNGSPLNNNANKLDTSEVGEYSVTVSLPGTIYTITTTIILTSGGGISEAIEINDLTVLEAYNDNIADFDLLPVQDQLSLLFENSTNYEISFYENLNDAQLGSNQLGLTYTNTTNPQTLYAKIENDNSCFIITDFMLNILQDIPPPPTGEATQTFTTGETLANLEVEGQNIQWYATTAGDTPLNIDTALEDGVTYFSTQTINGIESNDRLAVTVRFVAELDDIAFTGFKYYPNPTSDIITFSNTADIETVFVINTLGQTVIIKKVNYSSTQIDLSYLPDGVYLAKIDVGGKSKTIKILKK